jgi:hypothetical protein
MRKFIETLSTLKILSTDSWDRKGAMMKEFIQKNYYETLKAMRNAIQEKAWNADIRCSYLPN